MSHSRRWKKVQEQNRQDAKKIPPGVVRRWRESLRSDVKRNPDAHIEVFRGGAPGLGKRHK